ncbi:hypothetical protein [Desulfobacula sp.]
MKQKDLWMLEEQHEGLNSISRKTRIETRDIHSKNGLHYLSEFHIQKNKD